VTPTHRLRGRVAWLVGRASLHAQRLIQERFASHDLRKQHYGVLASLADLGPASQGPLADRLCLDRSDLVTFLDELEGRGLVARTADASDRRRKIVQLTPAGASLLAGLDDLVFAADDELLADLTPDERETLVKLLQRILPASESGRS
jgi:MarR family transcriptional regulator, lower aerobic nicotinate degradation pathway regulator